MMKKEGRREREEGRQNEEKRWNKELSILLFVITFFEIFLMMNSVTANSYQIREVEEGRGETEVIGLKGEEKEDKIIGMLLSLVSIKQIGIVSASLSEIYFGEVYNGEYKETYNSFFSSTTTTSCCKEMKNGAICQNVPSNFENCTETIFPTKCENLDSCKYGCCYDDEEGLCYPNSPKEICENNGGSWSSEEDCNNELCRQGCCIVGESISYTTDTRCQFLSSQAGFETINFDSSLTISQCLKKQKEQTVGACILEIGTCVFGTEAECYENEGTFKNGKLCSNPDLNSSCVKQFSTSCVEGKDEIYWFDSCGNRENIYSSDKEASWNDGFVLNKSLSCNPNDANIDSENCGNCDYEIGSACTNASSKKIIDGDYVCSSMNCVDEFGNERINGESWCAYDGVIGNGTDVVGSRHWREICVDGEVTVEPCADYRQEVCAEGTQINSAGKNVSLSTCRTNRWKNCISINSATEEDLDGETKQQACEKDSDCNWKNITLGDNTLNYCLPSYPPGFDFWNKETQATDICSIATQTCTYVEDCNGCVANCECIEEIHTQRLNDFCASLGDCGGYVNIEGVYSEKGYTIKEAPKLGEGYIAKLKELINPIQGQFCKIGKVVDYGYAEWERKNSTSGDGEGFNSDIFLYVGIGAAIMTTITSLTVMASSFLWFVPIFWAAALILFLVLWFFLDCPVEETTVKFTCLPYSAPTEKSQTCESCNDDSSRPCSEYRCKSLGAACVLENEGTENPVCFEDSKGDITAPIINFGQINESVYKVTEMENGVEITNLDGSCINEFTPVFFTINTSEFATCKMEYNRTNSYEDMSEYFGGTNLYDKEHLGFYNMINVDYLLGLLNNDAIDENTKEELIEKIRYMDMYIRCQDSHENYNIDEYVVRFCVKNGPDLTPPLLIATSPKDKSYVEYGETEKDLSIYIIEPAECKFSYTANLSYDEMENNFNCDTNIQHATNYGWNCNSTINLEGNQTNVYIKCKDQPWLEDSTYAYLLEEGRARNVNAEDYIFTFYASKGTLEISSISPEGEIINGVEPTTIELSAKTTGGATGDGYAVCSYNFKEQGWKAEFQVTGTNEHTQEGFSINSGNYLLKVICKDSAGNIAEKEQGFSISLDTSAPKVVRAYRSGSSINIVTNEETRCSFNEDTCYFNFDNGTKMDSGALSNSHQTSWKSGAVYHIKCEDIWGNKNNECAIKISADEFVGGN